MLRLDAFEFKPAPVYDLVCEDGDQSGLEDWSTAVFVEIALLGISGCCEECWGCCGQPTCGLLLGVSGSIFGASGGWYVDCMRCWKMGARRVTGARSLVVRSMLAFIDENAGVYSCLAPVL